MREIQFFVPGKAATAGSKKFMGFSKQGIPRLVDSCKRGPQWRGDVQACAREALLDQGPFRSGPLHLFCRFYMPRPKAHYKKDGTLRPSAPIFCITKPDTTKMVRAIEDALTHVLWNDDNLVVSQDPMKLYELPGYPVGVKVYITEIPLYMVADFQDSDLLKRRYYEGEVD